MRIQIIEDTVCPWCRIGKHNLHQALDEWQKTNDEPVEFEYLPFLLDPVEPGSKENFRERFTTRKGIPADSIATMFDRVVGVGKQAGITFNFDKIEVAVDTVPSHELILLTPQEKKADVIEAVMKAYFEDGKDIGEDDVLIQCARDAGLTDEQLAVIEPLLRSHAMRDRVLAIIGSVQQAGITGVPFFIIDGKLAVSGAQPPTHFLQAFAQASTMEAVAD
ncbi:MAG TPA: DsbA family oxidoreductase [Thermomicrobiales bacterium]|nr:DsbA family oxidoreductase [Thermomicrobiales bacterium]